MTTSPSKLRLGLIPPHTKCPYETACIYQARGFCNHTGLRHEVSYLCYMAKELDANHAPKQPQRAR